LQAEAVDGQDVRAVYEIAGRLVERARRGGGPSFLVCNTYRYTGHHVGDINREYYRSKEEEKHWKSERDPLKLLADWLIAQGLADSAQFKAMQSEVEAEMKKAVEFAVAAPYPGVSEVEQDVYA
jgi:acetoin:2,6-dichlorophenolindophenol oxidoreductase subunit alpha